MTKTTTKDDANAAVRTIRRNKPDRKHLGGLSASFKDEMPSSTPPSPMTDDVGLKQPLTDLVDAENTNEDVEGHSRGLGPLLSSSDASIVPLTTLVQKNKEPSHLEYVTAHGKVKEVIEALRDRMDDVKYEDLPMSGDIRLIHFPRFVLLGFEGWDNLKLVYTHVEQLGTNIANVILEKPLSFIRNNELFDRTKPIAVEVHDTNTTVYKGHGYLCRLRGFVREGEGIMTNSAGEVIGKGIYESDAVTNGTTESNRLVYKRFALYNVCVQFVDTEGQRHENLREWIKTNDYDECFQSLSHYFASKFRGPFHPRSLRDLALSTTGRRDLSGYFEFLDSIF